MCHHPRTLAVEILGNVVCVLRAGMAGLLLRYASLFSVCSPERCGDLGRSLFYARLRSRLDPLDDSSGMPAIKDGPYRCEPSP